MKYFFETDIQVPMRDGIKLATDVWQPKDSEPAPTLLVRTSYGKDSPEMLAAGIMPNIFELLEAGYAIVFQDCRGTFKSEGDNVNMAHEPNDGADTLAWLSSQPWCDGNIGTFGPSYLGFVQWASASTGASNLKAISTGVTSTDYYKAPWYSEGGALSLNTMYGWSTRMGVGHALRDLKTLSDPNLISERYQEIQVLMNILANPIQHLSKMPLSGQRHLEKHFPLWFEWIDHPSRDQYWVDQAVAEKFEEVKVPA
jgi:uncharacterized protein